jgi:sortase A
MLAHGTRLVVHNVRVSDVDEPGAEEPKPATPAKGGRRRASRTDRPAAHARTVVEDGEPGDADEPGDAPNGEPAAKRGTGRRITFWIGIGLILAGLGMLGYVGWQLWGTNWISKRHQREITAQLQTEWSAGTGTKPKFVPKGQASALIRIPRFGKSFVVPVLEGVSQDVLAKGFGHFEKTANPGEVGNYAIAGHRVTHGEPLRHMPDLRPGDKVIVETVDTTYTYVLDTNPNDLVISFTGVWVLDALPHNPTPGGPEPDQVPGQRLITLTTCSEIFHTDNRMIAFGHLATAHPKAAG